MEYSPKEINGKLPLIIQFHGAEDTTVSPIQSDEMIAKLKETNKDVKYSRIDGVGHDVWNNAYNKELLEWMLSKKRNA